MEVDRIVDSLVRDRFIGVVGLHEAQYVRHLLWRPARAQILAHDLTERAIGIEFRRSARCDKPGVTVKHS